VGPTRSPNGQQSFDQEVAELETAFEEAEQQTLENPGAAEAIAAALFALVAAWVANNVPRIYVAGVIEALTALDLPLQNVAELGERMHDAVARNLELDLLEALFASVSQLERQGRSRQRERERSDAAANLAGQPVTDPLGPLREEPSREPRREPGERPPFFVDRGGRRWSFGRYATMIARDAVTDIRNTAIGMVGAAVGSPGVRISDGHQADTDLPCQQANGQAWSIPYFLANTKEHPNCVRRGRLLPRNWTGVLDRE
jgi:hypothetical protein